MNHILQVSHTVWLSHGDHSQQSLIKYYGTGAKRQRSVDASRLKRHELPLRDAAYTSADWFKARFTDPWPASFTRPHLLRQNEPSLKKRLAQTSLCSLCLPPHNNQLLQWQQRRRGTCYAIFTPSLTKWAEMWNKRSAETGTDSPFPCYVIRTPLLVSIFHPSNSLPFLLCSFLIYIFVKVELYER